MVLKHGRTFVSYFLFVRHFPFKGGTESPQCLSIYKAGAVSVSVYSVQNVRQTYQNIQNVHKTSWFLYRTFTVNLVMYRMFRNAVRCLDVKQRHLNLPLLFIINEVDKRVLLWYKLSITEGIGNTFFSFESVIKLLDCTFPWIWRTIKIDLFSATCNIRNTLGESEGVVAHCFRLGIYSNPIDSSIHASPARTWTPCIDYRTEPYFLGGISLFDGRSLLLPILEMGQH